MLSSCDVDFNKCLWRSPYPSQSIHFGWTTRRFIILLLVLVLSVRTFASHVTFLIAPIAQKLSIWSSIRISFPVILWILGVLWILWVLWVLWDSAVPLCGIAL